MEDYPHGHSEHHHDHGLCKLIPETAGYDSFQHNGLKYTTLTTSLIGGKLVPQGCRGHGDLHYVLQQGGEGGGDGVNHWQEE